MEYIENNNKVNLPINNNEDYTPELLKDIDWDNMNESFFDTVFPSVVGHGKIIDKYLSDPRADYHATVVRDNIHFHG